MDISIPALIIGAILLLASSLTARGSIQSYDQLSRSFQSMQTRVAEQTQTRLSVTATSLNPARDRLTVSLRNDGQTRVAAYDRIDIIVTYYTDATTQVSVWLPYTSSAVASAEWTVATITADGLDPGILNPGETAEIEIALMPPVAAGKTNSVLISASTGASITVSFTS